MSGDLPGRTAPERLMAALVAVGVPQAEVDRARAAGELGLLAIDRLLRPDAFRYDTDEIAAMSGVDPVLVRRLHRALGFTDLPPATKAYGEEDVAMLRSIRRYLDDGIADAEVVVQLTRVVGSSMARIADAQVDVLEELMDVAHLRGDDAVELALGMVGALHDEWAQVFAYVHRRHLQAVAKRASFVREDDTAANRLAVGFADLVGFTVLSQELDEHELARVVDGFESTAYDVVARCGGRVVKMIGDEVMFVADDHRAAADIGLGLAEAYGAADAVTDVRVGIAAGQVVAHGGDYFGPVVNLASRIVNIAYAGSVVVSEDVFRSLEGDDGYGWKPIRPRFLKGIGLTPLWAVTRPGEGAPVATEVARRVRAHRNRGRRR